MKLFEIAKVLFAGIGFLKSYCQTLLLRYFNVKTFKKYNIEIKAEDILGYLKYSKSDKKAAVVIKIMAESTSVVLKVAKLFDDRK